MNGISVIVKDEQGARFFLFVPEPDWIPLDIRDAEKKCGRPSRLLEVKNADGFTLYVDWS